MTKFAVVMIEVDEDLPDDAALLHAIKGLKPRELRYHTPIKGKPPLIEEPESLDFIDIDADTSVPPHVDVPLAASPEDTELIGTARGRERLPKERGVNTPGPKGVSVFDPGPRDKDKDKPDTGPKKDSNKVKI
jgi:hypothetical protein